MRKRPNNALTLFGELILSLQGQVGKRGIGQQKDVKKRNIINFPEYILNFLLETGCDAVLELVKTTTIPSGKSRRVKMILVCSRGRGHAKIGFF